METFPDLENEREKIESMRKEVSEMVEELEDEGYKFKFREEGSEFIIGLDDREVRFPVMGVIPVQEKKGDSPTPYTIQEVIRASIAEPGSNLVETLHKFQKQDAEEKIRLEVLRKELRDFQKKEETGEEKSSHLIETPGNPEVNLDVLTKKDLKMYGKLDDFTFEEFDKYRRNIPKKDENRCQFAAFLANRATLRLALKQLEKEKEK